MDKTALSYWFPRIEAAGLPVPKTKIIEMPEEAQGVIWKAFDGVDGGAAAKPFFAEIKAACAELGLPCFLRTDYTSGKHNWDETCFVSEVNKIPAHVFAIAEFSECAGIIGLPWQTWVVREFLPTLSFGICPRYGNMPVCREFRFFVDDGAVRCVHPYWPEDSLAEGGVDSGIDYAELCRMDDKEALRGMAALAGAAVGGSWSVDILETKRGWYVTDMAEAEKSYHWEGCPHSGR